MTHTKKSWSNLIKIANLKSVAVWRDDSGNYKYSSNGYEWISFNGNFSQFFDFVNAM